MSLPTFFIHHATSAKIYVSYPVGTTSSMVKNKILMKKKKQLKKKIRNFLEITEGDRDYGSANLSF